MGNIWGQRHMTVTSFHFLHHRDMLERVRVGLLQGQKKPKNIIHQYACENEPK